MAKNFTLAALLVAFFTMSFAREYKADALAYLQKNKTELRLSDQDVADLVLVSEHYDDHSKINRVWLQQTVNGIPLKNGFIGVHIKDGKVVYATNSGVFELKKQVGDVKALLDARAAVLKSAGYVNVPGVSIPKHKAFDKAKGEYQFAPVEGLSRHEITAKLQLVMENETKVRLAWDIQFEGTKNFHMWNMEIDAKDGSLIKKQDLVLHCNFGEGKYLSSQENTQGHEGHTHEYRVLEEQPASLVSSSASTAQSMAGSYRVYPYFVESPIYGVRQLIANPDDAVASPFGWHDTNGAAGAEYTYTRGNNVSAYTDKDGNDGAFPSTGIDAAKADGGAGLVFDFPIDFSKRLDTLDNSKAVVTQLFYMSNIMHDIFFKYGFNESNANFQLRNYSGTTGANDPVYAEAHDGTRDQVTGQILKNNANFYASPDGMGIPSNRPRMQMFMWTSAEPSVFIIDAPPAIAGEYDHGDQSDWGPCTYNITAGVAIATSSGDTATQVCNSVNNAAAVTGKIAIIDRGSCDFSSKVFNAQLAGAVGVIIVGRPNEPVIGMSGGTNAAGVTIPAIFVTNAVGKLLKDNVATAMVNMYRASSNNCIEYDGALDNGIVAHEYGHGISIRLTGPASSNTCLRHEEQGGEGWSDFFAMVLSKKPADNKNTARGIGNYAMGEPINGVGIRRYPYSYDMSVNPLTYADLATSDGEHQYGEIWASALWDMYWNLIDKYGYSNDLYNGTGGNNRAIKLVVEGLKLQGCSPGFITSRNAILAANRILYAGADTCEIWQAFARRGMGFSASQGTINSTQDQTAAFDLPPACNTTLTPKFGVNKTTGCVGETLTFRDSTTGGPTSWLWRFGDGTTSTVQHPTKVYNTPGTYTVKLVVSNATLTDSLTKTSFITINALPSTNIVNNDTTICSGASVVLTATGAGAYAWTGGPATATYTVSPSVTTKYFVNGTTNGCSKLDSVTVTVNTTPTVTVTSPTICSGGTATLTAGGADSYTWTGGLSAVSNPTTPVLNSNATYTVTGTTNGCSATALSTVTVKAKPNVTITPDQQVCSGDSVVLTASGATSYQWNAGNPNNTASITVFPTGVSTYTVIGTTNGCTDTASTNITIKSKPTVTVTSSPICAGNTATLQASGATTYTWTGGLAAVSNPTTPVLNSNATYTVTGTTNGCSGTAVATVTVNAKPTVTVNSPTICAGNTATLTASGANTYTWSPNIGTGATVTTPVLNSNATYTVTGTNTTTTCSNTAVATVTVTNSAPTINVTPSSSSVCEGTAVTLTASGADTYTWSQAGTTTANSLTFTPTGDVTVTVTGSLTGCGLTGNGSASITVKTKPTVSVDKATASICSGETITLTASGADSYSWSPNIGSGATVTSGALTANTTYTVTGTTNGCSNTATSVVTVKTLPNTTLSASDNSICSGESVTLTAGGADSYSWTPSGAGSSQVVSPTSNVTYTVTGTTNGCSKAASQSITVSTTPATPAITQSNDTLYSSVVSAGAQYKWYKGSVLVATTSTAYYKLTSAGSYTLVITNGECTSGESAAIAAVYTGIKNKTNAIEELQVFPNPTDGQIRLTLNLNKVGKVSIGVFTTEGRELQTTVYGTMRQLQAEIDMSGYASGLYLLKITIDDEVHYHKVSKH